MSFFDDFKKMLGDWRGWIIPGYAPVKLTQSMFNDVGKVLTGDVSSANAQNIELQREVNAQNQYNIEHAHQIEVADLQAAGLNPWLSVGGGAQMANLQAAQVQPEGTSKMLQAATALMLMLAMKSLPGVGAAGTSQAKKVIHYLGGRI